MRDVRAVRGREPLDRYREHQLCPDAPALHDPAVVRAIRNSVIGVLVEHLPQPQGRRAALETRARELAFVFARVAQPGARSTEEEKP